MAYVYYFLHCKSGKSIPMLKCCMHSFINFQYTSFGTEHIKTKVSELCRNLHNNLFTHSNFVFLDKTSIRDLLKARLPASSEPIIVYNNLLRSVAFVLELDMLTKAVNKPS